MTGLGASIYLGFFVLAAVWLFLTSDGPLVLDRDKRKRGQRQEQDRSNSTSADAEFDGSMPWLVSHSSQK